MKNIIVGYIFLSVLFSVGLWVGVGAMFSSGYDGVTAFAFFYWWWGIGVGIAVRGHFARIFPD